MSIPAVNISRVSTLQFSNVATQQITANEQQLLLVEKELSTGKQINEPSDNPSSAAVIQQLQTTLAQGTGYATNISAAQSQLGETDATLGDLTNLLQQAQTLASQNVGSNVSADQRNSAASVVDSLYNQALIIANKQFNGSYLFGGNNSATAPYVTATGGVQFVGSTTTMKTTVDQNTELDYQISGADVFGGTSSQVTGTTSLAPALSGADRIIDLKGATSSGVDLGSIQIGNGTTSATVDLSSASTVSDVVNDINNAGLAGVTASVGQFGLQLTATGGANITVNEIGGGTTAATLGILQTVAAGPNVNVAGGNIGANITQFTPLSSLRGGLGIDPTGFTITNGTSSKTIAITGSMSVEDLLNEVNGAGLGLTAQINSTGDGINILNAVQGTSMTISENGGTSAADLGIRSLIANTPLSQLNNGAGVNTVSGNDFSLATADGSVVNVDLNNPQTIQDVLDQINTAAAGKVTATITTTGNGIALTDNTVGGGTFAVTALNFSTAAHDLGLTTPAAGNVIQGTDTNGITAPGIFTDLQTLRDSLRSNSQTGITTAAEALQVDSTTVTQMRGRTGAMEQELSSESDRLSAENVSTQALVSQLQDVDYATATTQFTQIQDSLQASLAAASKSMNLSLMDYISG